ncbi:MAG: NADH-quinone oxidoreductase subunit M [Nitrospirae bacterium]|nr:NADH-quinone oxidoreductase subunit M [Nitrospirota bacterium]
MEEIIYNASGFPILSWVIFSPLVGIALILLVKNSDLVRSIALGTSVVNFVLSIFIWLHFDPSTYRMQLGETIPWIPQFHINYTLGVDGISLWLIMLTTFLTPLCIVCSWNAIEKRVKEFMISILLMETAMLGVFMALDFILFYVFWEAMLIPMYLIIGVWGGPNRLYAAIKFFLYTLAGSLLLLIAIITLYFVGGETFDLLALMRGHYTPLLQFWLFWTFFIAFAIKVPMFPFHTWLPDAHVEAPTAGSVILASVLLKMGTYGFLRFCLPLAPGASHTYTMAILVLSVIAILYGAFMAMAQGDMKKLIAYSSVSHMGFVTLGIFAFNIQGVEGAILQMINHGITTGALFLCVGIIYDRTHSRQIADYGGIAKNMPVYATLLVIFSLSSLGLPGTNSFIGEFLVLVGAFLSNKIMGILATFGIIWAAVYMLWMLQRVLFGEITKESNGMLPDLSWRELSTLVPLLILVFYIGFYPNPFLNMMHATVNHLLEQLNAQSAYALSWRELIHGGYN